MTNAPVAAVAGAQPLPRVAAVAGVAVAGAAPGAPAAPCTKAPTEALPVHLHGIADQMPGDKEANERLIAHVDDTLAQHKKVRTRDE